MKLKKMMSRKLNRMMNLILDQLKESEYLDRLKKPRMNGHVYVPEVRLNLISVGRLDDEGYTGRIRNGVTNFSKGSLIMVQARKNNTSST